MEHEIPGLDNLPVFETCGLERDGSRKTTSLVEEEWSNGGQKFVGIPEFAAKMLNLQPPYFYQL